jgi:hypothetical protein
MSPKRGPQKTDHEWITLLSSRRADESAGAFTKRAGIPYTYLFTLLKRYPEVARLPAYAGRGVTGHGKKAPTSGGRPPKVRVLEPKVPKVPKLPKPVKLTANGKRMGRPLGSKNGARATLPPLKLADKPTPKDPERSDMRPIGAGSAEAMFYQDLSIALKSGRKLCISFQLMPEGA